MSLSFQQFTGTVLAQNSPARSFIKHELPHEFKSNPLADPERGHGVFLNRVFLKSLCLPPLAPVVHWREEERSALSPPTPRQRRPDILVSVFTRAALRTRRTPQVSALNPAFLRHLERDSNSSRRCWSHSAAFGSIRKDQATSLCR